MKKLLFQFIVLIGFSLNIYSQGVAPVLSNFRVEDPHKDRVYFDVDGDLSGLTTQGFVISDKTITSVNTSGNYFTVSQPFTYWDNNTIRLGENNDTSDVNNKMHNFSLTYIENKINEPTAYAKTMYVAPDGSDSNNGTSISTPYKTLGKALKNSVSGGYIIHVKAGVYAPENIGYSDNGSDGTITNPGVVQGYKTTPGDLNDVSLYYSYGDGALDPSEMPLFDGGNRSSGGTFINVSITNYRIFRNLQITNYTGGFTVASNAIRTGLVFENILLKDHGDNRDSGSGSSNGTGIVLNNSALGTNKVRIKDCLAINMTSEAFKTAGNGTAMLNSKAYCNESSSQVMFATTDYYFMMNGSNGIVKDCYAFRDTPTGHYGHGVAFKAEAGDCKYNLSVNNEMVNIFGSYELRWTAAKYNVVKNCISRANVSKRTSSYNASAGVMFISGGSDNIIENNTFHDLDNGIAFWDYNEDGDAGSVMGNNNIIRNNIFYNLKQFIAASPSGSNKKSLPVENKLYNNTIYNVDYMWRLGGGGSQIEFDSSNSMINNSFTSIKSEFRENNSTGWTYDKNNFYNSYTDSKGTNSSNLDPKFVNPTNGNFTPQNILLNKGESLKEVPYDINGKERKGQYTIGAVEFQDETTGSVKANAGEDQTICKGEEVTLIASGGDSYSWSNGQTTKSITVKPSETTTYTVTVSDGNTSDTDDVIVMVNSITANAGADVTINAGEEVILTASGGDSYQWSNGEATQSITVSPEKTSTYTVTVSRDGCDATDQVKVEVNQQSVGAVIASAGEDQAICNGDEVTLTASGGDTYSWSNGQTTKSITVKPSETTTYTVTVSDGNTSDTDDVIVTVNSVTANAGADVTINAGEEVILTASGGDSYQWSTGETTSSITVSPLNTKTYKVKAIKNGCEDTDELKVTVEPIIAGVIANAGDDLVICQGEEVTLTASGGSQYNWSNGETTQNITVSPTETTTYEVTVSDGHTSDTDQVTVNVQQVEAYAGEDVTIERFDNITLAASGGDTYLWSNGETTESITVQPEKTTIYSVTAFVKGCEATDEIEVKVVKQNSDKVVADAGEDTTICPGEEVILEASGGTHYEWSNGESSKSIKVSPIQTVTYSVIVTNGMISDQDEITIKVNQINADAGQDVTIKEGESVELKANGGDTYLWSNGETSKSIEVAPEFTSTYEVKVGKNGCFAYDTVTVNVIPENDSIITAFAGSDVFICYGEKITLTASGGSFFHWNTGETTKSIIVSPESTTTYTVEVSDGEHSDIDEVIVKLNDIKADAGENRIIEEGDEVSLTASGGDSYLWNNGETSKTITVSPSETSIFSVTAFKNGCQDSDSVQITVEKRNNENDQEPPIANAGEDVTICIGDSVSLNAEGGTTYLWSTADTSASIIVSPKRTTTYELEATRGGMTSTDIVTVYVEECNNLSYEDTLALKMIVYPNPSHGLVNMNISGVQKDLNLVLYDLNGRVVHSEVINSRSNTINKQVNLTRLPKGVYLVHISSSNQSLVSKLLLV